MEISYPMSSKQKLKDEDLLKAVRTSDSSVFKSLSLKQLAEVFFLKNEDTHSLIRVAISPSAHQFQAATTSSNGDGKVSDIKVLSLRVLISIDEARCLQL
ncbi:hypothetical protein ACFX12_028568 [Malus domestica]